MILRTAFGFAVVAIAVCFILPMGCSGHTGNSILPEENPVVSPPEKEAQSERILWGVWQFTYDESSNELTPIPLREAYIHYNITPMLLPPNCNDCLKIKVNSFDPVTRILDADVTLRNPTQLTGYDVRGILYTNDYGHELRNADDWTGLWDIAGGQSINPFRAFAKSIDHRAFTPAFEDTEKYLLYIPIPPYYEKITFAADASWPGNCIEPYEITNFWQENITNKIGSSGNIYVDVHDWQGDVYNVILFASTITGETFITFEQVSADTWGGHLTNKTGAPVGDYKVRLRANSKDAGITALHDYVTLSITEYYIPMVAGIDPDEAKAGSYLTGVKVSGSGFEGPSAQVKLKMNGKPDILADNVMVVEESTITCDISIPIDAALGLYDVDVTNGNGLSSTGVELFEVLAPLTPNVVSINPDNVTYGHELTGVKVSGSGFEGPGAQVKLKMNGKPDIVAGNVSVINETAITCDISIPIDAALGLYDVEVTNGNGLSGIGKELFEVHGPLTPNVEGINPDMATQGHPLSGVIVSGSGFEGPGTQVKLKMNGKPDIVASNVAVVEESTITCNINIPPDATPGLYDVEVINWSGSSSVGKELFEVIEATQFNPIDVTPPGLNFSPNDIYVEGNYAYIAAGVNGMHIFDISDLSNPIWVNWVGMPQYAYGVAVTDGYAYVANWSAGLRIIDIDPPESSYIVKTVGVKGAIRHVAVSGGYAYVTYTTTYDGNGLHIIDIDPPESAHIVKTVDTLAGHVVVSGGYAYVTGYGLQIIDIDPPESAYIVNTVHTPGGLLGVSVSGGYAYAAGGYEGLQIIDIEPPDSAYIVKTVDTPGSAYDVAISEGYAYVADYSKGLQIIDIDPPELAHIVNTVAMQGAARDVDVSGGYAYVADERSGFQIIDIDPPGSEYIVNTVPTPGYALGVAVSGGYAYVANGYAGLRIIDIDPPESAYIVKTVDTPGAYGVVVSGGYAYVADEYTGLQIIDIDPPESAYIIKTVDTPGAYGVAVSDGYAYLVGGYGGLRIIDIDPPELAYIVKTVDLPGYPNKGVAISGGYAYVTAHSLGLQIIDVDPLESAYIVKSVYTPWYAFGVAVSGGYAYVSDSYWSEIYEHGYGLRIIDVTSPESAYIVKGVSLPQYVGNGLALSGAYAYVPAGGLQIIDVVPPEFAYIVKTVNMPDGAQDVSLSGECAYVADARGGLRIIKLW